MDLIDMAYEIIRMDNVIRRQEKEIEDLKWYKEQYNELLDKNTEHHQKVVGTILTSLLKKGENE